MIIIEFLEGQGLGNQLWNYFAGIGISMANDMEVRICSISNFKGSSFLNLKVSECSSQDYADAIMIAEQQYYLGKEDYVASDVDYKFFHLNKDKKYILRGLFQSEAYTRFIQDFSLWINVNDTKGYYFDAILNIRGGEYKRQSKFHLPTSYWHNALLSLGPTDFVVVTDDKKYAEKLFQNSRIISGIEGSFMAIYTAKNAIVSNSTFSYWPLKLGSKCDRIIAPYNFARYNMNERWCSWANAYEAWSYIDKTGVLHQSSTVQELAYNQRLDFENKYSVLGKRKRIKGINIVKAIVPTFILKRLRIWLN